jgi:hypothetical protein
MEKGYFDVLTDELKNTMASIRTETKDMFKNTKPYRAVKVPNVDQLANYLNITPEVDQKLQQDMGIHYDTYKNNMENLLKGYKGV